MTTHTVAPEVFDTYGELSSTIPDRSTPRALRPLSPVPTYIGIAVAAVGLLLICLAWSGVAGEANVSRQVPYLVSGGILGLAVVLIGLTVVNVASKRRETALREQQSRLLADAIDQLGRVLGDDGLQQR